MEPIDDFFKKKFEERDLPFNEAHWAAAQQLLDQQQQRRRAIWWWWAGFVGVALAVAVFLVWPAWWAPSSFTPHATLQAFPIPERQGVAASENRLREPQSASGIASESEAVSTAHLQWEATTPPPLSSSSKGQAASSSSSVAEVSVSGINTAPSDTGTMDSIAATPSVQSALLTPLPVLAIAPEFTGDNPPPDLAAQAVNPIRKWHFSTLLGGSIHAAEGKTAPVLGIRATYAIAPRWSLYAEALYRARPVKPSTAQRSLQQQFGFGLNEQSYELQATSLHYVDANLGAAYRFSRHAIYAGGGLSYLTGARGQLRQAVKAESDSGFAPQQTTAEGWIDTKASPHFHLRAQAGYEYQLLPRLGLHLRAQYRIGPEAIPSVLNAPLSIDLMLNYSL